MIQANPLQLTLAALTRPGLKNEDGKNRMLIEWEARVRRRRQTSARSIWCPRCQDSPDLMHASTMKAQTPPPPALLTLVRQLLPFLPAHLHEQLQREAPAVALHAMRLGWEVLSAEQQEITFSAAVERPDFVLMARTYHGAINLLQWQLPPPIQEAIRSLLRQAIEGHLEVRLESVRKLLFEVARREEDPEAGLCRFLLWAAVQVNLLIATWDKTSLQANGVLESMEDRTHKILQILLDVPDMDEPDYRPLHMLVGAALYEMVEVAESLPLVTEAEADNLERLADALQSIRGLGARDAAILNPGEFTGASGSQLIIDRFPQHGFTSVNAVDQQRRRLRGKLQNPPAVPGRLVDLIREAGEGVQPK